MMSYDGLQEVRSLGELRDLIGECDRCKLSITRNKIIFGSGASSARIVFVGEGPGSQEDKHGLPFVGRAGKVLDDLLGTIGLSRDDVFIANVVKCRPPNNRDPEPDEIEACSPFLFAQLRIIDPVVVVTLGNYASKLLTGLSEGISKIHGTLVQAKGYDIFPIYHPASALYTKAIMPILEEDMLALKKILLSKQISGSKQIVASKKTASNKKIGPKEVNFRGASITEEIGREGTMLETTMSEVTTSIELILRSPGEMGRFAARLAKNLASGDILLLNGRLGAGKTALVKGLAKGLGIKETITSPTFVILRTYPSANASLGVPGLDHIDLYRLGRDDVEALGIQEVLEGENIIAIEWPDIFKSLISKIGDRSRMIEIDLEVTGRSERVATLRFHDTRKNILKGLENFRP